MMSRLVVPSMSLDEEKVGRRMVIGPGDFIWRRRLRCSALRGSCAGMWGAR